MTQYIVRRVLLSIPALLGVIFIVFVIARLLPGDPCIAALGERANAQVCEAFNQRYGLNEPIPVQFLLYIGQVLTGDLGESIRQGRPVTEILIERLPTTMELAAYSLLFASVVGVTLGLISALRRNSRTDVTTMFGAILGVSIPIFVLALVLQFIFAVVLKGTIFQLPPSGRLSPGLDYMTIAEAWGLEDVQGLPRAMLDFFSAIYTLSFTITLQWEALLDAIRHLILPVIALGTISLAIIARITRSSLLEVLGLDYIRTARAKGVSEPSVLRRHAFRNAMLPVVTIIGLQLGLLLAGAVLTETVFNLTGVGRTMYEAIVGRDYIVVQGFTLVIAIIYLVVNLIVDISYAFLDPRIGWHERARMTIQADPGVPVVDSDVAVSRVRTPGRWRETLGNVLSQRSARVGLVLLGFLVFVALFADVIAPYDPVDNLNGPGEPGRRADPCIHLLGCPADQPETYLGTDGNSRDIFSRVVHGARLSLPIGPLVVGFAVLVGAFIGGVAGFAGGMSDNILMRVMDVVLSFPALILAIAVVTMLGTGLLNAVAAVVIVTIPLYARLTRSAVLQTRENDYVTASRALGELGSGILRRRILPNSITPIIVAGSLGIATAVLEVAALSFLGLGIPEPFAEWGAMIGRDFNSIFNKPLLVLAPAFMLTITVLAFNLIGDGLRDAFDPRLNR